MDNVFDTEMALVLQLLCSPLKVGQDLMSGYHLQSLFSNINDSVILEMRHLQRGGQIPHLK